MGGDCFQMPRFFVKREAVDETSGIINITGEDVNHIKNVLRMNQRESLTVSDDSGKDYEAVIVSLEKDIVVACITGVRLNETEPPVDVVLYQGIPKSDKMDLIIQKCVELGISKIVPVLNARTIVKLDSSKDAAAKTARWQRISLEAAKQCSRGTVPEVAFPLSFEKALGELGESSHSLIPYELEKNGSLRHFIKSCTASYNCKNCVSTKFLINVFIGPEGGFTEEEIIKAKKHGVVPVTMGPRILRTETAGLAVLSILMYELGDMGK